jgi:hypothetical protein
VDFLYNLGIGSSLIRVRSFTLNPDPPRHKLQGNVTLVNGPDTTGHVLRDLLHQDMPSNVDQGIHNVPVHVHGTVSDGSAQVTTVDVSVGSLDEARCTVSEADQTLEVVRVGGKDYVRASVRVWMFLPALSNAGTAARAEGKYVRAPMRSAELGRLTKFLDVTQTLSDELAATQTATIGETAIINGVPTVAITPITPGLAPLPIGTIYVATVGEPYVIRWVSPGEVGSLDFSDYTKPVVIDTPPTDKTIDLDALIHP